MITLNLQKEKDEINKIIHHGLREILYKGLRVNNNSLGNIEDDVNLMLRAIQLKGRIYDFASIIIENTLFSRFEGKIIYILIKSDEPQYEEEIKFYF